MAPPPRRHGPPRAVTVARIETLSPLMRRIIFIGDALEGFGPAKPGAHIKLIFGELAVDFLLHGTGLASEWAARAQVGERLHIGGPGGRHRHQPRASCRRAVGR